MTRLLILSCLCFLNLSAFSQGENQIKLRYWNGTTDGKGISNPVGLEVSAVNVHISNALVPVDEAALSSQEPKFYLKKKFVLFFTVQNVGTNDVAIYDWAFKAVCPVDNMGRKFDATSMAQLVTPYIPGNIFIVLKPGEKKQFYSAETDFYWCLPQDKDDLLHDPKYFQGLITCASINGSAIAANSSQKQGGFQPPTTPPQKSENNLDPQLERIIREHNDLIQKNENEKAEMFKSRILRITNLAYPAQTKLVESKLMTPKEATNDSWSNWLFMNGDKAVQVRYRQVKQESEIGYFSVQFRINFEDPIFCSHPTCLGYLFVFGYPTLDNKSTIEKSFKFYNSYKEIYTLQDTIAIRLSFDDGSKRFLRKEGFFYTLANSSVEEPAIYLFSNCVDDILSNNPNYHRCKPYKSNFKDSEATIIQ